MKNTNQTSFGIEDMAFYSPSLYLDIKTLAEARNLPYEKLLYGLGLEKMAFPDVHEDAATMAANAIAELIERNELDPSKIGRIYMGTESAVDGSKPTASYALDMLCQKFGGENFVHCDVVDLTFACIGGVDALQNVMDWVRAGEDRYGIVVCSDFAKYDLNSGGEYTQGAGAVAMLVKSNPSLLAIADTWGTATLSVHDFFKPRRLLSRKDLVASAKNEESTPWYAEEDEWISIFKETPVFDGQYSNLCYQQRIKEAFFHLKNQNVNTKNWEKNATASQAWARMIFHLPYAFHGKRIFTDLFLEDLVNTGKETSFLKENEIEKPDQASFENGVAFAKAEAGFYRAISKTKSYKQLVKEKIEKGQRASSQIGNVYTASLFLSLMSMLEIEADEASDLEGKKIGFFAYGSGSKSKVFEGTLQNNWAAVSKRFDIFKKLSKRKEIDYPTYESLHRLKLEKSVEVPNGEFFLDRVEKEKGMQEGARYYGWAD